MAIFPIVTYDDPLLRSHAEPVDSNSPELQKFIDDLFETMYEASGVGLAAPQVGRSLQIFIVDADAITESEGEPAHGPMVFINPVITPDQEELWDAEEGCLSIPDVREKVTRPDSIRIRFLDRDFHPREEQHHGWFARVLQHEYDHLHGVLFIDHLGAFRKRLIKSKLDEIKSGRIETEYQLASKTSVDK